MKSPLRLLIIIVATMACCEVALAAGGGHGTKPATLSDSYLPESSSVQLTDLVNRPERVGGYWINSNNWFYFAGDTKKLNDFLCQYAKLTETPLVLVIHAGKAPAEECIGEMFKTPYDWKLDSMYPAFTRDTTWFRKPNGGKWRRVVILQVWLGGNIRLDELKVPPNIEVRSGGEIERFIENHNKNKVVWGAAVEGVQCRLQPEKSVWKKGQTLRLQADLWNRGQRNVTMGLYPTSWEVQCDGIWYRATARFSGTIERLILKPGDQRDSISLLLENRFEWRSKGDNRPMQFKLGKHTLRAAFYLRREGAPELHVESNPVEMEIVEEDPVSGVSAKKIFNPSADKRTPSVNKPSDDEGRTSPTLDPVGTWQSVDFVRKIEEFQPGSKKWQGDLFLKQCQFFRNGRTSLGKTWKGDWITHSNGRTRAQFFIKTLGGESYLFLPWLSGDVVDRVMKPSFYVLKRKGLRETEGTDVQPTPVGTRQSSVQTIRPVASVEKFHDVR